MFSFLTSGGILIVLGLYFIFKNPLDVSFNNLILVVVIWPIIFAIVDFLFRKNKFNKNNAYNKTFLFHCFISFYQYMNIYYLSNNQSIQYYSEV